MKAVAEEEAEEAHRYNQYLGLRDLKTVLSSLLGEGRSPSRRAQDTIART